MLSIETRHAQNIIEQAKQVAKQVHEVIVVENATAGSQLLNSLAEADARAAAAYMILDSLAEIEATGATELDKGAATLLLSKVKDHLRNSIYGNSHEKTIWMLNDYVRWLEDALPAISLVEEHIALRESRAL